MSDGSVGVADLIKQSNILLGVIARAHMRDVLAKELKDAKKKQLYEMTDGKATAREIAAGIGMSISNISTTWQHWEECGLVYKDGQKYRRTLG